MRTALIALFTACLLTLTVGQAGTRATPNCTGPFVCDVRLDATQIVDLRP